MLDERLANAAAARKSCVAGDLLGTLRIVEASDGKKIVSWSEFDLNVVLNADLPEGLKNHFLIVG